MKSVLVRRIAVPILPLLLAGCVGGLLGGGKPDQLYRFGAPAIPPGGDVALQPPTPQQGTLLLPLPVFAPEIAGDRILTSEGRKVSYIKSARWVTATPILYRAALVEALRTRVPDVIVVERQRGGTSAYGLKVEITRFEAVYVEPKVPPTVQIEGRVTMIADGSDRPPAIVRIVGEQPATANTAVAIAAAFDAAVSQSTNNVAGWVARRARPQTVVPSPVEPAR